MAALPVECFKHWAVVVVPCALESTGSQRGVCGPPGGPDGPLHVCNATDQTLEKPFPQMIQTSANDAVQHLALTYLVPIPTKVGFSEPAVECRSRHKSGYNVYIK